MMYEDENHTTLFDFSKANSVFEPHMLASLYSEYISDVDFVLESDNDLLLLEYKNNTVSCADRPQAFTEKIKGGKLANVLIKKFYGTLLLIFLTGRNQRNKTIRYTCLIEVGKEIDEVMMKRLRNKVSKGLPFKFNEKQEIRAPVIDQFEIVNIQEWNNKYPQYPIKLKEQTKIAN